MGNSNSADNNDSRPVTEVIGSSDIVLFKMEHCPYCDNAITALKDAGFESKTAVVLASESQREELYGITQVASLPSVWIKGKYVGGCNDGPEPWMGIKKIIAADKLKSMVNNE